LPWSEFVVASNIGKGKASLQHCSSWQVSSGSCSFISFLKAYRWQSSGLRHPGVSSVAARKGLSGQVRSGVCQQVQGESSMSQTSLQPNQAFKPTGHEKPCPAA
jgi:hypothetical protein